MTQRDDFLSDADLDSLFAEARADIADVMAPSDDFMARVLADACDVQAAAGAGVPDWAQPKSEPAARPRDGWLSALLYSVGGWRGGAGLATATVMGLAVGLGAPSTVSQLAAGTWSGTLDSTAVTQVDTTATDTTSFALDDLVPSFYDLAEG